MGVASEWLRTNRVTVAVAARALGDDSEAAFRRAFTRTMGRSPSAARRDEVVPDRGSR